MKRFLPALRWGFAMVAGLWLLTGGVAVACLVVYPWFSLVPQLLGYLAAAMGALLLLLGGGPRWRRGLLVALALAVVLPVLAAGSFVLFTLLAPRQNHWETTSPGGTVTLVLEDDIVDIPTVYRRHGPFMTKVFRPPVFYNQTVGFEVAWLDENRFVLYSLLYPEEDRWEILLS